jgi:hypothetical protein
MAVLLGCGLRRSEVAALILAHIQQRDGRWCKRGSGWEAWPGADGADATWLKVAIDA